MHASWLWVIFGHYTISHKSHHSWSFCWSTPRPVSRSDCSMRDRKVRERAVDETCPEPLFPSTWQSPESQAFADTSQTLPVSQGQSMEVDNVERERHSEWVLYVWYRERKREREGGRGRDYSSLLFYSLPSSSCWAAVMVLVCWGSGGGSTMSVCLEGSPSEIRTEPSLAEGWPRSAISAIITTHEKMELQSLDVRDHYNAIPI